MNTSGFFLLFSILFAEILTGYGMAFRFAEQPRQPDQETPVVAEEEMIQEEVKEETVKDEKQEVAAIEIRNIELTPQGQLANPPDAVRAVYFTSWSGGSKKKIDYVINLAKTTGVNAVVIDIKDFSGQIAYNTNVPEAETYQAEVIKIWDIDALIDRLHQEGIYVIARVTVFQDPILTAQRPDLSVQSKATEGVWKDYKGLGWIDPASKEAWNYNVAIARDAASRGFDEINFDYIRFPSDGDLQSMEFPLWDGQTSRRAVLKEFFAYLDANLQDVKISADLFGLATVQKDDLGIGQVLEDAYGYFDYVCPMVYPSHYANGFLGYPKPAEYPYEVVKYSLQRAHERLQALELANPGVRFAKLRPWLQDFDLGATYDGLMVQAQIQATNEVLGANSPGYLLWAPTNIYTVEALNPFVFDQKTYDTRPRTSLEPTP